MHQSSTYQWVLNEGREQGLEQGREEGIVIGKRECLLKLGQRKLGPAPTRIQKSLNAITVPEQLDQLIEHIEEVKTWSELLRIGKSSNPGIPPAK